MSASTVVCANPNAPLTPDLEAWVTFNRKYSEMWPVIVTKKDPLPDAEARDGEKDKIKTYFSEAAGTGG